MAPAVPPGGAAPVIVTSSDADDSFRRDAARRAGTTLPDPTLTAPTVPSAGTTIVNSPFGTSVPYYGGITTIGGIIATGGSGGVLSDGGGITFGAFTLVPQIEINVGFDSNVFAQSAALGTTQSLYTTVTPSLDLRSEWLNHSLHVLASGTIGWYGVAPTQNFQNYGVLVDGKIDIRQRLLCHLRDRLPALDRGAGHAQRGVRPGADRGRHAADRDRPLSGVQPGFLPARAPRRRASGIRTTARSSARACRDPAATASSMASRSSSATSSSRTSRSLSPLRSIRSATSRRSIRPGRQRNSDGTNFCVGATWQVNAISMLEGDDRLPETRLSIRAWAARRPFRTALRAPDGLCAADLRPDHLAVDQ